MASYSPIFSQGFIYFTDSTPNTSFEVPDGFTAVVRDVNAATSLGGVVMGVYVKLSEAAPAVIFAYSTALGEFATYQWQGRVVCPAGGIIGLDGAAVGYGLGVYVGGYLLRNTLS